MVGTFDPTDRSYRHRAISSLGPGSLRAGSAPAQRPHTGTRLQWQFSICCNLIGLHGSPECLVCESIVIIS